MKCYQHAELEAVATCIRCGKAVCQRCAVSVGGSLLCQQCLSLPSVSPNYTPGKPTNTLAIISLILGILGLCMGILGIPAWITGHLAIKQIKEDPNQEGMQYATIGKWMGIVVTAVYGLLLVCYFGFLFLSFGSILIQSIIQSR
jgi:hypothetical protein